MLPIPLLTGIPDIGTIFTTLNQLITLVNAYAPGLLAYSITAGGNGADTTEDVLQTFTMPAGTLNANGKGYRIKAWGITANNAHTKTLRVYHGTTSFSFTLTASDAGPWEVEMIVMRSGAAAQIAMAKCTDDTAFIATVQSISGSDTLSSALVVKVTGQTSTSAANDIVCNGATIELIQ